METRDVLIRAVSRRRGGKGSMLQASAAWRRCIPLFAWLVLVMGGCASQPTQLPPWTFPQLPTPRVAPLPLTVGVYYPENLVREQYEEKSQPIWYMHQPGSASISLLDSVLIASFRKVVHVREWPPAGGAEPQVDLVIVPRVVGLSMGQGYITYEIGFFTPEGASTGKWSVHATAEVSFFTSHETFIASVMRDAAARLLIGFRERPEVTAHLPEGELASSTPRPVSDNTRNTTIALLPKAPNDEEWLECIQNGIREGAPSVRFIEFEPFRNALFPWFEPSGEEPTTPEAWAKRLSDRLIAQGAEQMGARYVLLVGGETSNGTLNGNFMCTASTGMIGCFGLSTGTRNTGLQLTLADFARRELVGKVDVTEAGEYTWVGVVLPIGFASTTETDACKKAAEGIVELLEGR